MSNVILTSVSRTASGRLVRATGSSLGGGAGTPSPTGNSTTGVLAATVAAKKVVVRTSTGLYLFDGSVAHGKLLLGGGFCVVGGTAGATVPYFPTGGLAPVGATGWAQDVPLYPNGNGDLVPYGDPSLAGVYTREFAIYDGSKLAIAICGDVQGF